MCAQVLQGTTHASCCVVVRNCQRCLFVVGQPGIFGGDELRRLEAEADVNPGARGLLLQHVHVRPWLDEKIDVSWRSSGQTCSAASPAALTAAWAGGAASTSALD